jgi:hypothetical protein
MKGSFFAFEGVQQLGVTGGTQGGNDQGLGFATGEQRRTVGLRQHADFDVQRTYGLGVAAVDTWLAVDDVFANGAVFDFAEDVFDFAAEGWPSSPENLATPGRAARPGARSGRP